MARGRKIAGKKTAGKKTARKKIVSKKLAVKRATKAVKKVARKKTVARKVAAKKASVKKTAAKKKVVKKTTAKKVTSKKVTSKKVLARKAKKPVAARKQIKASASPTPPSRRQAPRNSSGRRLAARAPVSRAQLVKKTLVEAKRAKPANAQQKAAKKAKQLQTRKKALAKDKRLPASRSPSARVRRNVGSDAPSSRRLSIRAAVTHATSRSPVQRAGAAVAEPPFRLHQLGIRDEHPTDRAAILALLAEALGDSAHAEKLQALRLEDRIGGVLVAQHGERLVGCGALFINAIETGDGDVPVAEIGVLAVTPTLQRKGIGTQLVLAMIESARASGAKVLLAQRLDELLLDLGFSTDSVAKLDGNMTVLGLKLTEDGEDELVGRLKQPIS